MGREEGSAAVRPERGTQLINGWGICSLRYVIGREIESQGCVTVDHASNV